MNQRHPKQHDEKHLARIRQVSCLVCLNNIQTEAAHIRYGDIDRGKRHSGIGERPDDKWTVPLCQKCHAHQHTMNERRFWEIAGIDPLEVAEKLFDAGDHEERERIVRAYH